MVFVILEENRLSNFKSDMLKISAIIVILFILGFLPYVDQWAHIGGFVMGFLFGGIFLPAAEEDEDQPKKKNEKCLRFVKYLKWSFVIVFIPLVIILFVVFFVVFYVVQPYCQGCSYLTCPFQTGGLTVCIDQTATLRDRV